MRWRIQKPFFAKLAQSLSEAVALYVRYEYKDSKGENRRERNKRFNRESPDIVWPEEGIYLKDWFFEIRSGVKPGEIITWTDLKHWVDVTKNNIREEEIIAIKSMDDSYCRQVAIERNEDLGRNREKPAGNQNGRHY